MLRTGTSLRNNARRGTVQALSASRVSLSTALRSRLGAGPSSSEAPISYLQRRSTHRRNSISTTAATPSGPSSAAMGAITTGKVDTTARVKQLRELMKEHNIDAYVIPSEDEHASEYPAESDLRRGFISGFSGSAGCAVVTQSQAALFTDGRYFLQADQQLEPKVWTLMKQGEPSVPTWQEYLSKNVAAKSKIGMDA